MPIHIKHRGKHSATAQQPEMTLVATESTLISKVTYMVRTTAF
jgi:hypothetical protein